MGSAKMRAAHVMGRVARRKVKVIRSGRIWRVERGFFVKAKNDLQGLGKVRANFLRKLHQVKMEQFRLVGILRHKQLTSSRKLHHAVEKSQGVEKDACWDIGACVRTFETANT